jgi:hypothetical protein
MTKATPYTETIYKRLPPPTATPTAAANQTDAAVVNPWTSCDDVVTSCPFTSRVDEVEPFQMSPAPKNPTPLGTAAAYG